jgi:GTP pyrophosphokinase
MTQNAVILGERFEQAVCLAMELHREQRRKGTSIPYASHLLAVTSLVLEAGANEDEAIAAVLHDSVEDCGAELLPTLRERFGEAVADIVAGCTDSQVVPRPPWRERKESYLQHLQTATPSMLLVTSADKLHNARCILLDYRKHGEALWSRFAGGREGVLWYYGALVDALSALAPSTLVDELARTVSELKSLAAQST